MFMHVNQNDYIKYLKNFKIITIICTPNIFLNYTQTVENIKQ